MQERNYRELKMVQYNTRKSPDRQGPFLADKLVQKYDIIAIQEPVRNRGMQTTTASKGHTLIYPSKGNPRACLYTSKRIDPTAWSVIVEEPDLVGIELRGRTRL